MQKEPGLGLARHALMGLGAEAINLMDGLADSLIHFTIKDSSPGWVNSFSHC
jgi:hypothetical protein